MAISLREVPRDDRVVQETRWSRLRSRAGCTQVLYELKAPARHESNAIHSQIAAGHRRNDASPRISRKRVSQSTARYESSGLSTSLRLERCHRHRRPEPPLPHARPRPGRWPSALSSRRQTAPRCPPRGRRFALLHVLDGRSSVGRIDGSLTSRLDRARLLAIGLVTLIPDPGPGRQGPLASGRHQFFCYDDDRARIHAAAEHCGNRVCRWRPQSRVNSTRKNLQETLPVVVVALSKSSVGPGAGFQNSETLTRCSAATASVWPGGRRTTPSKNVLV